MPPPLGSQSRWAACAATKSCNRRPGGRAAGKPPCQHTTQTTRRVHPPTRMPAPPPCQRGRTCRRRRRCSLSSASPGRSAGRRHAGRPGGPAQASRRCSRRSAPCWAGAAAGGGRCGGARRGAPLGPPAPLVGVKGCVPALQVCSAFTVRQQQPFAAAGQWSSAGPRS